MFFQSKPTVILYLRRQDAVFIDKSNSVRFDIPLDLVQNLEVRDAGKLTELIASFLEGRQCRGQQVLLVLDTDVVFQKDVLTKDTPNPEAVAADFESKVPFEPANRQMINFIEKGQLHMLGINRPLQQAIAQGIQKANKLKAIVPASLYGITHSKTINRQTISTLFNDSTPLSRANFLTKM